MPGDWQLDLIKHQPSLPEPSQTPSEQRREGALVRLPHMRGLRPACKPSLPDAVGCGRLNLAPLPVLWHLPAWDANGSDSYLLPALDALPRVSP